MTRAQSIEALRSKFAVWAQNGNTLPATLPLLSEGATYRMELTGSETVVTAKLLRIVEDSPLGRGFSFQLRNRRLFVYERDLQPGPGGILIAMVA